MIRYWTKDYLVLPLKYLYDVKHADKRHLSFLDNIPDVSLCLYLLFYEADQQVFFMNYWVGDLFSSDRMVYVVKKGLNPQLRTNPTGLAQAFSLRLDS